MDSGTQNLVEVEEAADNRSQNLTEEVADNRIQNLLVVVEAEENMIQNLMEVEEAEENMTQNQTEEVADNRTQNLMLAEDNRTQNLVLAEVEMYPLTWQEEEGVEEGSWCLWGSSMEVAAGGGLRSW